MRIGNTTALVTGGASGLGAATARRLADAGARVLAVDLPAAVDRAAPYAGIRYAAADVTSPDDVQAAVNSIGADQPPLRIVVNCAGIAPARKVLGSKGPHDLDLFRRAVEVNLIGTFNVLRLAAAAISQTEPDEQGQRGVIINTASVAAFEGQIGQVAYSASKGGVVGMMLPAARDLAAVGIRVNTIAPGIVDTPMLAGLGPEVGASLAASIPFPQRLARPDEFAQLAQVIIEHDYLNAETVRMDGALRMAPS
ncbi:NAD(P)-dependent dehydrogenase (short-subunit alcohol dehydrogenase family) [Microbacterium trichothecenolyticum]|uniref:SDR family NAD(P)-dependent oxidoreductase n=1 Tax=Microbacterium trichothecenolyticum TaxID=69370 RepID=UPI00285E70A6|nr:SDR family NAD(P)-dependent oxidoreductase [Microbacterium trichothecenolyticum]MDR7112261.1 NAD(P)-dependent dehydrogenase (short-subunit alcohol dehydrogenase family) [Microbacterium trichothecenolyticum]